MHNLSQPSAQTRGGFHPQEVRFFELSVDLLCLIDHEGIVRHLNSAVERILGYRPADIIGRSFLEFVRDEDQRAALQEFGQIKSGRDSREFECRVRCKDESYVWLSCSCAAPSADDPLVFAICRDVTRWKQAEDALQVAQQQLLQILDNTSAVIYVKQLDGRYLLVNRQYERLFNVTRDEVLSLTDDDLFPPEVAEAFRANDRLVAETEDVITMEEIAPHPDGPHTYISVKFPLRDVSGRVYAVAGISTDISQRARAEQELAATKNRLELILDAISEGVIGVDATGEITFLNTAAEQLLNTRHAAERRTVGPETRNLVDLLQGLNPEGRSASREIELQRDDGKTAYLSCSVQSVLDQGQPAGNVITVRDATAQHERQVLEQDMQSARAVQQVLLPHQIPQIDGLEIAGTVFPASLLCGDYLDFIPHGNDQISTIVADVSGHGFGPAMRMVEARSYLRAILEVEHCPAAALKRLNRYFMSDYLDGSFTSAFLARWDAPERALTYAAAGHEAWLLRREGPPHRLHPTGLVLGIDEESVFQSVGPIEVASGDLLLLLTDGVFETMSADRELFGWPRTLSTVQALRNRPAAEIVDHLYQATRRYCGTQEQADDVAIGVVRIV